MIQKITKLLGSNYSNSNFNVKYKQNKQLETDNIVISDVARQKFREAKLLSEVNSITKLTMGRIDSDITKAEKLQIIKAKLNNNEYDNLSKEVLDKIAENITNVFFGKENKYF